MRASILVALAVAPFALAQFGMGEDGSPIGGYGSDALASCSSGDNAGCSAYVAEANKCYQIMVDGGTEEEAMACACNPNSDFLSAFETCAACVTTAAGGDSSSAGDYAAQFTDACKLVNEAGDGSSPSTSFRESSASTAPTDASTSTPSQTSASSSSTSSAGAHTTATASTEVAGSTPTGAGARDAVGVAGLVGFVFSAMALVA